MFLYECDYQVLLRPCGQKYRAFLVLPAGPLRKPLPHTTTISVLTPSTAYSSMHPRKKRVHRSTSTIDTTPTPAPFVIAQGGSTVVVILILRISSTHHGPSPARGNCLPNFSLPTVFNCAPFRTFLPRAKFLAQPHLGTPTAGKLPKIALFLACLAEYGLRKLPLRRCFFLRVFFR